MLNALLYLRVVSGRNWVIARGRRLRQPKYLLGAIVGCAYFYFFFFGQFGGNSARQVPRGSPDEAMHALEHASVTLPVDWLPATTALGALALLSFTMFMWVVPT